MQSLVCLLLLLLVPFYRIYWFCRTARRVDAIGESRGVASNTAIPSLILAIVFNLTSPIVIRERMNAIITEGKEP